MSDWARIRIWEHWDCPRTFYLEYQGRGLLFDGGFDYLYCPLSSAALLPQRGQQSAGAVMVGVGLLLAHGPALDEAQLPAGVLAFQ